MNRCLGVLLFPLVLAGCRAGPLGPYTSPRVTGYVCAATTGAPLGDVKVTRGRSSRPAPGESPKGGELMIRKVPIETGSDGKFTLQSERVLSVFRGAGWNQVRLTFERPGYETLRTNYSASPATNTAKGEPVLDVGRILLQPASKPGVLNE